MINTQINRRKALLGISAAAFAASVSSTSALAEGAIATQPDTAGAADDRLRKDLAGMAHRADSEEGVPVLLACVNLVPERTGIKAPAAKLSPMNKAVAADFHATAAAWQRLKPNAAEGDVGSMIQVLALRDFAIVGKGGKA
jgi:hypothetical protein